MRVEVECPSLVALTFYDEVVGMGVHRAPRIGRVPAAPTVKWSNYNLNEAHTVAPPVFGELVGTTFSLSIVIGRCMIAFLTSYESAADTITTKRLCKCSPVLLSLCTHAVILQELFNIGLDPLIRFC